jgi:hypothetical protein
VDARDRRDRPAAAVWADALGTAVNNVVITESSDGGRRCSAPKPIDQAPGPHAFNQTVQVAGDGTVAVPLLRLPHQPARSVLPTDVWLTQSTDGGASWEEQHVTGPFDMNWPPTPAATSSATTWDWRRAETA